MEKLSFEEGDPVQLLFENTAAGLVICAPDGTFLNVNPHFCEILGFSREELLGMNFRDITYPEDLQSDLDLLQNLLLGKTSNYQLEKRYVCKDTSIKWVSLSTSIIRNNNNEPTYLLGTVIDITARKNAESELNDRRQAWENIFQAIGHPSVLLNEQRKIIDVNNAFLQKSGKKKDDIIGDLCCSYFTHNGSGEDYQCPMLCYSESNYSKPDVFEQNIFGGNYLVNCTPILDKKGKVSNVIVISTDITELKRIEQNLHESENRYVSLLNTAPVGIAVHQDDRIVFVNPAGCKIMGATTADDIVGKSISAFIHPENQDLYLSRKEKMLKGDTEIYPAEDKYLRIDGHAIDVEVYATSIIYKGKPAVQIIVMDITDRKSFETTLVEKNKEYESLNEEYTSLNEELEEHNKKLLKLNEDLKQAKDRAEESEQLKTIFLTNMSHEVRTPLNAIIGFASLLDEDDLPAEDRKEFISIIHNSGDRLIRLIDDILDLSKIESKNLVVSCEMYNLHELISSSLQTFGKSELLNKKPALELRYNLNPRLSKQQIYTDRIRFKQVLDNLINNAIKYTEKGYVEVGYELLKADHSHMIEISVKDTGKGIPQEKADLIFERFRQVEEFSYHEGTGLGLSIVKGITNLLGGDIRFTSIPGEGSTFYFTLPVDHEIENHSMQHENLVEKPDLSGKHIIIAEDDPNSALFLQTLLDSSDVRIDTAENGLKLMEMIEESSPDLVLLDINMPIISGYECLLEIKAKKPEIPIICQTAYAMPGERDKCVAAGCSGYLTKPILKEVLFRTIDEVLKP